MTTFCLDSRFLRFWLLCPFAASCSATIFVIFPTNADVDVVFIVEVVVGLEGASLKILSAYETRYFC